MVIKPSPIALEAVILGVGLSQLLRVGQLFHNQGNLLGSYHGSLLKNVTSLYLAANENNNRQPLERRYNTGRQGLIRYRGKPAYVGSPDIETRPSRSSRRPSVCSRARRSFSTAPLTASSTVAASLVTATGWCPTRCASMAQR